eukprot:scaffold274964_cov28-Tisochrysis_lutea.AAC.1
MCRKSAVAPRAGRRVRGLLPDQDGGGGCAAHTGGRGALAAAAAAHDWGVRSRSVKDGTSLKLGHRTSNVHSRLQQCSYTLTRMPNFVYIHGPRWTELFFRMRRAFSELSDRGAKCKCKAAKKLHLSGGPVTLRSGEAAT